MLNKYFLSLYNAISRNKTITFIFFGLIIISSVICLRFINFSNNIELMVPGDEELLRSMKFLRESNFSDKVVLSLELNSPKYNTDDLIQAVDKLSANLGQPYVISIISNSDRIDFMKELPLFLKYVPQLIDKQKLSEIENKISPQEIEISLRKNYRQLLTPASIYMMTFIRSDPIGINSEVLKSLVKLSSSLGYRVNIKDGHFISEDGKHAMIILKTSVVITDGFGSRKLISYLQEKLKVLPDYVSADIIAGHLHSISNEDVIKKDIRLTSIVTIICFIMLFLFVFRDVKAIIVFIIPFIANTIAITISGLFYNNLAYFVVGMGTVITGIAVDYGIYVYIAINNSDDTAESLQQVFVPIITAALTTIGSFFVFFFSSAKGYHELAFFSGTSIIICILCNFFILPQFFNKNKKIKKLNIVDPANINIFLSDKSSIVLWLILMIGAFVLSTGLTFKSDIMQFDGSEPQIIQAEKKFHQVWGGEDQQAIFVVEGNTLDEALSINELIYNKATAELGVNNFTSFTSIWPSKQTRKLNLKNWNQFWENGHEDKLRNLINEYGSKYNFSKDAFQPFFENLYSEIDIADEPKNVEFFNQIKEKFIIKNIDGYKILSFFPDDNNNIKKLSAISNQYQGTFIVSRKALSQTLSKTVSKEINFLLIFAILMTVLITFICLKEIKLVIIAMIPVITSILVPLAIIKLMGLYLNAPVVFSILIVLGLTSDYGIFMAHFYRFNLKTKTPIVVLLCAITTIIGTGVLLLAKHPMLFSIGLTLVTGVVSGYIASVVVVPSACKIWLTKIQIIEENI